MESMTGFRVSSRFLYACFGAVLIAGTASILSLGNRALPVWSSSMAPDFKGPCLRFQCPQCGRRHFLTADRPFGDKIKRIRFARCPECGFSEIPVTSDQWEEGESVRLLLKWLDFGRPQRWEPVAFALSDDETEWTSDAASDEATSLGNHFVISAEKQPLGLKRIVGLPGDTVEIDRGDLRVNGQIASKPTFDFARVPLLTLRPIRLPDRVLFQNRPPKPFLSGKEPQESIPTPITNLPPAERIEPIPFDRIENVRDFILEFPFPSKVNSKETVSKETDLPPLKILANQGDQFWLVVLDVKNDRANVYQRPNSEPERAEEAFAKLTPDFFPSESVRTVALWGKTGRFILAFCDRQAVLQIRNGREITELVRIPEETDSPAAGTTTSTGKNPPITTPFAIITGPANSGDDKDAGSASVTKWQFDSFQVFRDIHYSIPQNGRSKWTLGDDDYLLLGDNSAVSLDARDWKEPTVTRKRIRRILKRNANE